MFYPGYTEVKTITSAAFTMGALQTFSLRIPQQKRRLAAMLVELIYTETVVGTITLDGNWNLIPEIRFKVNDKLGARNAVQASAAQLILWAYDQTGNIPRQSLQSRACITASTQKLSVPIFFRHPAVGEPVGNLLALPLNELNDDPILEIDVVGGASATGVGASAQPTAGLGLRVTLCYVDTEANLGYIPTELLNNTWTVSGSGPSSFDLANSGFVSSISLDTYTTYPTTRAAMFTANDHAYQVKIGSINRKEFFPESLQAINDFQVGVGNMEAAGVGLVSLIYSSGGVLLGPLATHYALDFLFDESNAGAFSPASLLNANTVQLGGDKIRLIGTNFSAGGTVRVLTHKFATPNANDLKALIGA